MAKTPILLEAARTIIDKPIPLIIDKKPEIVPPNASLHDFLSVDPYSYRTKNGELVKKDGEINKLTESFPDPKKLDDAVNGILITSLAAVVTKDQAERRKFAQRAISTLKAWFIDEGTMMTPSLEYAQMKPGETTGNFYGIIEGVGLIRAVEGVNKLKGASLMNQETLNGVEH